MKGSDYKISAKTAAVQFPFFSHKKRIAIRKRPYRQNKKIIIEK